jgi:ATP-dependent helicase/nuclease subunit A
MPLALIERAFRELGVPCDSPRQGGLLKTLEAEDLIALLSVLVMPTDDLSLAQVLKSPIYGLDDSDLMSLVTEKRQKNADCIWHIIQEENSFYHHVALQIADWINRAKHLPVHDLLDHIYASAQVRLRYVESAPKLQREQVLSNLDAFLGLALDLDGGRYPSLNRFISELKKIKRGAEEESPDEGDSLVEDDEQLESDLSSKQVRILTIHAAKGLEARFVILMNANSSRGNQDHVGVLMNWQPDQPAPSHMSPFFSGKPRDLARQHLREQEEAIAQIENWNLLYVALTRAKESVYISGAAAKANQEMNELSWYGRLSRAGIPELEMDDSFFEAPNQIQEPKPTDQSFKDFVVSWHGQARPTLFAEDLVLSQDQQLIDLGVAFHLVMEHVTRLSLNDVSQLPTAEALVSWLNLPRQIALEARACALTTLQSPAAQHFFFDPNILQRWAELDIADFDGRLLRIDALVEYSDHLAILDYKLSIPAPDTELFEKYQKQLSFYKAAVGALRADKPIKTFLISAEGTVLELF